MHTSAVTWLPTRHYFRGYDRCFRRPEADHHIQCEFGDHEHHRQDQQAGSDGTTPGRLGRNRGLSRQRRRGLRVSPDAPRHRSGWLEKLARAGVRRRAEQLYEQLDKLVQIRREARQELLRESRKLSQASWEGLGRA
jgi:lipopolysaccharide biosynthesis regulator YciM